MTCERTWFENIVDTTLIFNFSFQEILMVRCLVLGFSNTSVDYLQNYEKLLLILIL